MVESIKNLPARSPGWYPHPTESGMFAYFNGKNFTDPIAREALPANVTRPPVGYDGSLFAPLPGPSQFVRVRLDFWHTVRIAALGMLAANGVLFLLFRVATS